VPRKRTTANVDIGQVGILLRHRIGGDLIRPAAVAAYLM
jgi:hypothetical protein